MKKRSRKTRHDSRSSNRRRSASSHASTRSSRAFEIEALEPRILLSGTWTDTGGNPLAGATEGDDVFQASNQGDVADGLGGNDLLTGDQGADVFSGGAGNDRLFGGQGGDTLNGGAGNDQLYGEHGNDLLISGGGSDIMDGAQGSDTFRFNGAQNGDIVTVDGGTGNDTIDLTQYRGSDVSNNGSQIVVNLGGGQSLTINHSNVESVLVGNTEPVAGAGGLTVNEDSAAAPVTLSGTDPDAGDAVTQYRIESLPANGTLRLNGNAVNSGDVISQADVNGGNLTFQPSANWNGSTSFTYKAHDGDAWSLNTGTFSINVNAVNDAPVAGGGSLTVSEDAGPSAVTLSGTDPDSGDAVTQYRIESLPANGTLRLNGNAVNAGDVISQADVDGGNLTFQPNANWNGSTSFAYRAHDGDAWSANTGTFNLSVNAVNDAASAQAGADQTVDELSTVSLDASASSDLDGDNLTYAWTQESGPAVQLSNAAAASPTFAAPDVDAPTTLTFRVSVSDGQAMTSDTVTITVNPVAAPSPPSVPSAPPPPPVVPQPDPTDVAPEPPDTPVTPPVSDDGPPDVVADSPPQDSTPSDDAPPVLEPSDPAPVVDVAPTDPPVVTTPDPAPDIVSEDSGENTSSWPNAQTPVAFNPPPVVQPAPEGAIADDVTGGAPQAPSGSSSNNPPAVDGESGVAPGDGTHTEPAPFFEPVWSGHEDLGVLDPQADHGDAFADFAQDSVDDARLDSALPLLPAMEDHFNITQTVSLPTFGFSGPQSWNPPGAGSGGSVGEAFAELPDDAADRRWNTRYADAEGGADGGWLDDVEISSSASPHDSGVFASNEVGGFFARLWGAVRGLGGTAARAEDRSTDQRDNRRA